MMEITPETFEAEVLRSDQSVVVEFWAPWCGPCHAVKPLLQEFSDTEKGRVKVTQVNAQEHPELANRFGVMALPTFLVFRGGRVAGQHIGSLGRRQLAELAGVTA